MAQFYGLPTASLRAAAWRRMVEGGSSGFDVSLAGGEGARLWCSSRSQRRPLRCTGAHELRHVPPNLVPQVTTSVKLYNGKTLPPGNLPLYYDQIHPWGPTGHRWDALPHSRLPCPACLCAPEFAAAVFLAPAGLPLRLGPTLACTHALSHPSPQGAG